MGRTSRLATEDYVNARFGAVDALIFKGGIDASSNPNYPAADAGDVYKITAAGRIGGAAGPLVDVGDTLICSVDSSGAGDHATVGANWIVLRGDASAELLGETFGLVGDGLDASASANTAALTSFINALDAFTSPSGRLGEGDFRIEGALIDTKRGFEIDGQGTGDLARTGTTLRWKDASSTAAMLDLRSTHSIFMEGFRFRSGSQTGKDSAIISTANESPALSNLRTYLHDCAFQTDSPTSFASAFLNLKSSSNTSIHSSQFVGGVGLKIGKDSDVDPDTSNATLANGISSDIDTQNCIFVADVRLENCYNWTSLSDYFGLNPSTSTIAKISCTGLEEARSILFINPLIDPAGTSGNASIWFDGPTNASADHGPVIAICGQYTGADIMFNLPDGFGAVMGGKFVATNTPTAGIVLGPNFAGDIEPFTNNDFTDLMAAGVPAIDDQRSTHKFADADTTPSLLAGQKHQIADNPPAGGYSDFDDVIEGRHYTLAAGGSKSTKLNNGTSIGGPANETWYMAPGDAPVEVVPLGGKNYVFPLAPPRRSYGVYSEQTAGIVSGRIAPNKPAFIIASEVAGAPDNLVNIDLEAEDAFVFKRGAMLSARINSVDEPITILASGNIHTWNGHPVTLTDPNKCYWFRINSDGQGMTLMRDGLDAVELHNEPLGANDVGVIFFFGQSNQNVGVATTTAATLTHVDMMATGALSWSQYTTASTPYQNNCHLEQAATRYAGPYDSFAKLWEANQAAWSLPHLYAGLAAQGGEPFSSKNTTVNKSKWNPDRIKAQADGSPDPTTDGYFRSRKLTENVATPTWSLYDLAADMIRKGLEAIEATHKRPRLLGVVWVHGETDSTNATMAGEYARHLEQLYDHLAAAAGVEDLPFFITQVASQNYAHRAVVNSAMASFAATKKMARVLDPTTLPSYNAGDTGGSPPNLGLFSDGIHYTQAAYDEIADWVWASTIGRRFYGVVSGKSKRSKREPRLLFTGFYVPGGTYDSATQAAFVWNNVVRDDLELYNTGGSSDDSILIPWDGDYEIEISGLQSSESSKAAASELKIYLNGDPDTNPTGDATYQLKRSFLNKDTSGGELQRNSVCWRGALNAGDRIYGVYQGYLHTSSTTDKDHMISVKFLGE